MSYQNLKLGQFFRLSDCKGNYSNPKTNNIPLIGIPDGKDAITFFCSDKGKSARILEKLNLGDNISLMGPIGNSFPIQHNEKVLFLANSASQISILTHIKDNLKRIGCIVDINKEISKCYHKIFIMGEEAFIKSKAERTLIEGISNKTYLIVPSPMQCMMKGVCGCCLQINKLDERPFFACQNHIQKTDVIEFQGLENKIETSQIFSKFIELN